MEKKHRRFRVVLPIAAVVVLLVAGVFYYIAGIQRSLWNQTVAEILEVTSQGNHAFEIYVNKDMQILNRIVKHLSVLDAGDEALITREIDSFEDGEVYFTVIVPDRSLMYSRGGQGARQIEEEERRMFASFGQTGIREPYLDPYTGERMVGGYQRFSFADGTEGIIQVKRETTMVEAEFMLSFYNGAGVSYVINREGDILLMPSHLDGARTTINLLDEVERSVSGGADVEWLRGRIARGEEGVTRFRLDGEECVLAFTPVEGTDGWCLVAVVPDSVIMSHANNILKSTQTFIVLLGMILGGAGLVFFMKQWSDKKLLEKEDNVRYREQLFDILANNTNDVFLMFTTTDYKVEYVSPNIERVMGITCEAIKADIGELAHTSAGADWDYSAVKAMKPGDSISCERERIHRRTEEPRWFFETIYRTAVGGSQRFVAVLSDRTHERRSEDALKDALEIAKAANESKSVFLSNMSHDIRTPMNAIVGFSSLLQRDADNPEKVQEYTRKITASSQHLLGLINDVLDMSKIESGKTTLNISEISLAELVDELGTMIQPQAKAKRQEFQISVYDIRDEEVLGDRLRINQILINILSNAVKYTQEGGKIEMTVRQLPQKTKYYARFQIMIQDNGIGMTPDYLETIFQPFSRESSGRTASIQGTGLGMAITKNLVDLMGGTIQVDSALGEGSTFTVSLELRIKERNVDPDFWKKHGVFNLLVVDDEEAICAGIRTAMTETGVNVSYALGGQEAVRMAQEAQDAGRGFDLMLIDWQMPDISGIETARRMRQIVPPEVPIMILTAYDAGQLEKEGAEAGISGFLQKPFFLSNFKIVLDGLQETAEKPADQETDDVLSGRQILVAEDNELNSEILMELLEMAGAACEVTKNGQEVLERFAQSAPGRYDLILMDVQMPVMNGYEATKAIRACGHPQAKTIPIIAMTANAFAEDIKEALDAGMDQHVSKPVDMERLKQAVRVVISQEKE